MCLEGGAVHTCNVRWSSCACVQAPPGLRAQCHTLRCSATMSGAQPAHTPHPHVSISSAHVIMSHFSPAPQHWLQGAPSRARASPRAQSVRQRTQRGLDDARAHACCCAAPTPGHTPKTSVRVSIASPPMYVTHLHVLTALKRLRVFGDGDIGPTPESLGDLHMRLPACMHACECCPKRNRTHASYANRVVIALHDPLGSSQLLRTASTVRSSSPRALLSSSSSLLSRSSCVIGDTCCCGTASGGVATVANVTLGRDTGAAARAWKEGGAASG